MYSVYENSDNGTGFTVTQLWNVDTSFPVDDVSVLRIAAGTFCCVDGDSVVVVVVLATSGFVFHLRLLSCRVWNTKRKCWCCGSEPEIGGNLASQSLPTGLTQTQYIEGGNTPCTNHTRTCMLLWIVCRPTIHPCSTSIGHSGQAEVTLTNSFCVLLTSFSLLTFVR